MPPTIEAESALTDRYQTTVPETVRRALRLSKRDRVHYSIRPNGEVVLSRAPVAEVADPVLGHFLGFLAKDMQRHPERMQAVDSNYVEQLRNLVQGVVVDLDAPLSDADE
jgi:antitoxin PrlF